MDIQHHVLPPRLRGGRRDAGRLVHVSFPLGIHPVAHLYARAAEDLGIGTIWCGVGRQYAVADAARTDPRPQADDLGRHGQLRAAPRQSRRGARLRPRQRLGAQDHRRRRAAVAGQAAEARTRLGRRSLRPVRHDRGRADFGAVAGPRRAACVVGPVLLRSGRRDDRRAGARGRGRHAGDDGAVQQQRHAVPALEFRRSRQHDVARVTATGRGRCFR